MEKKRLIEKDPTLKKDDLIVITGAGGFIAGNLAKYFRDKGFTRIRAVDKKPLYEWYLHVPGVENLCLDVSNEDNCHRVCEGAVEVYNLAADMGGMGFIERFRVECLRSILINTHMIEAAWRALVDASGVVARQRDPLETRIHACGFDATSTTASSFQRACIRMLAADLNDTDVVTILDSCLLAPSPDAALRSSGALAST